MAKGKVRGLRAVRLWFSLAESSLQEHRDRLNRLNVFPVPDSDTGTNMLATLQTAHQAIDDSTTDDLGELLARAGSEAMATAYGNSGTLLAVILSGFAEPLHGHERFTVQALSEGLERGSLRAWSALSRPVSGTMLSVLDAISEDVRHQASAIDEPDSRAALIQALDSALSTGRRALESTEEQLGALKEAKVVDSGGAGLLLVLAALQAAVSGKPVSETLLEGLSGGSEENAPSGSSPICPHTSAEEGAAEGEDSVEIMCTVRLDPLGAASLRHELDAVGDSVIITPIDQEEDAEGTYRWRIHVHADDENRAAEVIRANGRVEDYTVTELYPPAADAP